MENKTSKSGIIKIVNKANKSSFNTKIKLTSLNKQLANNIELLGETVWVESSFDNSMLLEGLVIREARKLLVKLYDVDEPIVGTREQLWISQRMLDIAIDASNMY